MGRRVLFSSLSGALMLKRHSERVREDSDRSMDTGRYRLDLPKPKRYGMLQRRSDLTPTVRILCSRDPTMALDFAINGHSNDPMHTRIGISMIESHPFACNPTATTPFPSYNPTEQPRTAAPPSPRPWSSPEMHNARLRALRFTPNGATRSEE